MKHRILEKEGEYNAWSDWSVTSVSSTDARQTQTKVVTETYYELQDVIKTINVAFDQKCEAGYSIVNGKCQKTITNTSTVNPICPAKSGYTVTRNGFTCTYTKSTKEECPSTYNGYTLVSQNGLTCNYEKKTTENR